jgi:type I restriction enzyme S subunit
MPPFVYSPHLSYWRSLDPSRVEGGFLRYWSKGPEFTEQLGGMKASTDMAPYLSLIDQKRLRITLPPIGEQRAIAHILGTLDDKIELNRWMSETLEAMARALFKSWFVDFDPVRAKAEGRDPGLPKPLADLFPARLVDSELGEIPQGWEVKPIGDLAEVVGGSTPKTERSEYWEGGTHHWVTPKDLSGLSMPVLLDTERKITDAGLAQVSSGLLPKGTVLLSSRAPIGYLAIAEVPVAVNQGFVAMKPRPRISNLYLLRWASAAHDEIVSHANGSTFLEISKSNFRPIRVVAPAAPVTHAFDLLSRPMYLKVVEHERESRTLAALRDTLLPKLISGELRVKNAERIIEVTA